MSDLIAGALLTFAAAVTIIFLDAYQALSSITYRVPHFFWTSIPLMFFSSGCGVIAVAAFIYASTSAQSLEWLSNLLGAKINNLYLRAFYTGIAAVTIIRSKALQIRGADIGLEYFYSDLRAKTLGSILANWTEFRNRFIRERIDSIFNYPNIDMEIKDLISANVEFTDHKYKTSIISQLDEIFKNRPVNPIDKNDPQWRAFYRSLMNMALTNCGAEALQKKLT